MVLMQSLKHPLGIKRSINSMIHPREFLNWIYKTDKN